MVDKIISQEKNMGKGAALRNGFNNITGDIVTIRDADLEYNLKEDTTLLEPFIEGNVDVVYGSRFIGRQANSPGIILLAFPGKYKELALIRKTKKWSKKKIIIFTPNGVVWKDAYNNSSL